ncbi:MAG: YihY/virulence factor BrkB family protein [Chloroflexi bacterium]|nr:YihY/virulence factor BrkB family protein [Chloroflexota bacterium]
MKDDDATHLAAGVAYYAMFSLFPLLLGFLAISGLVLNSEGLEQKFMDFVTDNLPGSEQIVKENVGQVVRFRGLLGIGAFIGLLWSASAVFGAINRAVNRAWDIRQDRPFYIAKPRQLAMALGVGILFLLSTSATSAIQVFTDPSRDLGVPGQDFLLGIGLGHLALRMVPWAMTLLIFLMVYRFLPDCKTYWRFIWPGAVVASVLFEVAKSLFVWYLNNIATYDQVYGSLTSVMALLFWIYISALILILGAEISSEYGRMRLEQERGAAPELLEEDGR